MTENNNTIALFEGKETINDFEVMAPAGSYESLMAAIHAGADSIYFGIEALNMRSRSAYNFTNDDLYKIVDICNEHGVKTYLTVNIVIYDNDIPLMKETLMHAKEAGVSAVIVADVAALIEARRIGLEVHLSTQLNISNVPALRFYAQFADVVVLARELSMDQVGVIHQAIQEEQIKGPSGQLIRIEMFAHGALCMAVSGKCYLSLHEKNRSANRGSCTQICRRSYHVQDSSSGVELEIENQNIMSPKDLKTIHFMNKMMSAGVRVFKIEGRARGPEYVSRVVRAYKEAIQAVCDGTYSESMINGWDDSLKTVFNRGFWDGYYMGQKLGEWTPFTGSSATKEKEYIAKVIKHFGKIQVAEIELESGEINVGDDVLIIGPTTGVLDFKVSELRIELEPATKAVKGQRVSLPVPAKVRPADRVYLFKNRITNQQ